MSRRAELRRRARAEMKRTGQVEGPKVDLGRLRRDVAAGKLDGVDEDVLEKTLAVLEDGGFVARDGNDAVRLLQRDREVGAIEEKLVSRIGGLLEKRRWTLCSMPPEAGEDAGRPFWRFWPSNAHTFGFTEPTVLAPAVGFDADGVADSVGYTLRPPWGAGTAQVFYPDEQRLLTDLDVIEAMQPGDWPVPEADRYLHRDDFVELRPEPPLAPRPV